MRVTGQLGTSSAATVESIETDDAVLLARNYQMLLNEIAAFRAGTSSFSSLEQIRDHYWDDRDQITFPTT